MDEPDRSSADRPHDPPVAALPEAVWVRDLPPPPFVDPATHSGPPRFSALSPRVALLIGAAVVIGLLFWMARDNLRPFIVGLLLVYLLDPPVRWLTRRGLRRSLSILLVYVVVISGLVLFLDVTLTPLINEILRFIDELPSLAAQLQEQIQNLSDVYARLQIPDAIRAWIDALIAKMSEGGGGAPSIDVGVLLPLISGASSIVGTIFGYVILPVWVFYLLKDRVSLTAQFDRSLPSTWRFDTWAILRIVRRTFGQWVRAQLILGFAVGLFTFVGLTVLSYWYPIFGRYAILLSVIAGVLELVPIIGPIISAIPAVLIAATAGIEPAIAALVLYTLVQQVENNFLVPKIQGDAVELHPAAVIFAIVIGGALAGLLGAILALPITAAGRDVVRYLFRRLSPDAPEALATSIHGLGLERHPGIPGAGGIPVPHQGEGSAT